MEQIVSENLFLLEFLVDKCIILPCAIPKEVQQVTGETCVSFKFLDNEPLDICEEDFSPKRNYTDEENMKSGKSCLFAMSSTQAEEALVEFDIVVGVFKKLTNGMLPDKIQIGTALIPIAPTFNEIIELVKANTETPETVSRTLKDCFNIVNINDEVIGSVSAFLRMSCFGKLIVTQFQMNLDDKSVFFKDKEGKSLYKYRRASKAEVKSETAGAGTGRLKVCKPLQPSSARGEDPTMTDQYTSFDGRCQDCASPSPDMAVAYGDTYPPNVLSEAPVMPYTSTLTEKGNYQEIGAEMNGNSLTIRVHKNKGTVKRIDGEDTEIYDEQDKYTKSYQNTCTCNGGDKQALSSYHSNPPCTCLAGDKQMGHGSANPCYCLKPGMSQAPQRGGYPCAEKQILSLRPADDPNNPFAFRVSGCPGGGGNQNVTVVSPTNTRPDGMQVTEISDPNKDVFILRIGKKSEGTDKKANLELELVTPKGIDKKPTPKKVTQETQYNEKDAGPATGGKGGKAGKGGKGGKGKKGKKGKGGNGDADDQGGGDNERSGKGGGGGGKGHGAGGGKGDGAGGKGDGAGGGKGHGAEGRKSDAAGGGKGDGGGKGGDGAGGGKGDGAGGGKGDGAGGGKGDGAGGKDKKKDQSGPAFAGFQMMKADRLANLQQDEPCCCQPAYCWCCPAGWCKPVLCCGAPYCTYRSWKVPSNTYLQCSMGRITGAKTCCYCNS